LGEIAALATSFCWSFTSIQFTLAGQRIGSVVVNRARLVLAVLYLSLAHLLLQGELWPIHAEPFRWGWLGLSGTIGLVLGDSCLFQAFLLIGTRRAMLLMTLVPVISTLVAWGWLGETLHPVEMGAVLLTVSGIAWVVSERQQGQGAICSGRAAGPGGRARPGSGAGDGQAGACWGFSVLVGYADQDGGCHGRDLVAHPGPGPSWSDLAGAEG
jgi:drug/metabolite transporter (DMT)-like permease